MFGKIITKMSSFLFVDIARIIKVYFSSLGKALDYTNIGEDLETYLSNILFISFMVGFALEFLLILLMLKLNIFFTLLSFAITVFMAFTFAAGVFLILYKYPYYLVTTQKKELDSEIRYSLKHLSALSDKDLTVKDVLLILQVLENNKLLTKECKRILAYSNLNKNLRSTLEEVKGTTYSELEHDFFNKLIDVIDGRRKLPSVIKSFLESIEQSIKEEKEQRKSKINLLFQVNMFLFFLVLILLFSIFIMPIYEESIRSILMFLAIVFPIVEIVLMFILNK